MQYIKINESKLKIMLERKDLDDWDISIDELDYANPAARGVFEGLLAAAKTELGFDTSGHRVLLQLFPSKDGSCELFVTRLEELCQRHLPEEQDKKTTLELAYSFKHLSHLCAVCRRLYTCGFYGESSVYFDSDGRWFLLLRSQSEENGVLSALTRFSFISEYGEREEAQSLSLYLCEYATLVCEGNALSIFCDF